MTKGRRIIYIEQTQALADKFIVLIAEALDLQPATLNKVLLRKYPMSPLRISAYPRVESILLCLPIQWFRVLGLTRMVAS